MEGRRWKSRMLMIHVPMVLLASYFKERMFGQLQTDTQIIATVRASC